MTSPTRSKVPTMISSRTADKFVIRLTDGLRERISNIAQTHHRSMNSQMLVWLEMCVTAEEETGNPVNLEEMAKLFLQADAGPSAHIMVTKQPKFVPHEGDPVRYAGTVWLLHSYTVHSDDGAVYATLYHGNADARVFCKNLVNLNDLEPL